MLFVATRLLARSNCCSAGDRWACGGGIQPGHGLIFFLGKKNTTANAVGANKNRAAPIKQDQQYAISGSRLLPSCAVNLPNENENPRGETNSVRLPSAFHELKPHDTLSSKHLQLAYLHNCSGMPVAPRIRMHYRSAITWQQ